MKNILTSLIAGTVVFAGTVPAQAVKPEDNPAYRPVNRTTGPPIEPVFTITAHDMTWRQFKKLPQAKCIRKRESRNKPWVVSSNGLWHGLYQFYTPTWQKMGGTKYAPVASQATRKQQHKIAFKTWKRVGWSPWYHATKPCY